MNLFIKKIWHCYCPGMIFKIFVKPVYLFKMWLNLVKTVFKCIFYYCLFITKFLMHKLQTYNYESDVSPWYNILQERSP